MSVNLPSWLLPENFFKYKHLWGEHPMHPVNVKEKCSSCENKYNGRNGNGYQPCGCLCGEKSLPPKEV